MTYTSNKPSQSAGQTRLSLESIKAHKNKPQPLVCLTAYTAPMAAILDPHCDILLVGDSMGMVLYGMDNTLGVTLDMMIAHTKAVMRGSHTAFVLADMPYGTYEDSPTQALTNARRLMDETGCGAVKMEGDGTMAATVETLVAAGIPVMAHIGLRPQMVVQEGGYKVKGKTPEQAEALLQDALTLEKAGAFVILIEGTIEPVARSITQSLRVPTIGIGASVACDGQILVTDDMIGLLESNPPKFAKQYGAARKTISAMIEDYARDVRERSFPDAAHVYTAPKESAPKENAASLKKAS
jgi:3-methyl-2-oxobutanoate hydroxymethyltransferase